MRRHLRVLAATLSMLTLSIAPGIAAETQTTVRVALLDMSSIMPMGMMGYGMMSPGMMMGQGMMGGMMSIRLDKPTVKAGAVSFDVTNWSRSVLHEVLIVSVDNPAAPLPYDYPQARVPEDQVKVLGEGGDLQPNDSAGFEVTLAAGSYLLICNLPGHYAAGMAVPLSVTP